MAIILLTRQAEVENRGQPRFLGAIRRVDLCMTSTATRTLPDTVCDILAGPHLSVLATTNPDGEPQTSVIFITREGNDILFSTIKGRRKTTNMQRVPRVNLLVHRLPVGGAYPPYATMSGRVDLVDDPDGSLLQVMYNTHMGGATAPREPGAERLIVRMRPDKVYVPPQYQPTPADPVG
jgi:PPOX class probable F420-dependent enzyme